MLNLPVYLYTPIIRVFLDLENSTKKGVDMMYHGYATLAKGLKNTLRFSFLNGDQRSININGKSLRFSMFDQSTNIQVLTKHLDILDDTFQLLVSAGQLVTSKELTFTDTTGVEVGMSVTGLNIQRNTTVTAVTSTKVTLSLSTTAIVEQDTPINFYTLTLKGMAQLTIPSVDTVDLNSGRYVYSIVSEELDDQSNVVDISPAYIDGASNLNGLVDLVDGVTPKFIPSIELSFNRLNDLVTWTTGKKAVNNDGRGSVNLHTVAFYLNNFTGTVNIYASQQNSIDGDAGSWVLYDSANYSGQTSIESFNIEGSFTFFKFEYVKTSGTIDKALYRS